MADRCTAAHPRCMGEAARGHCTCPPASPRPSLTAKIRAALDRGETIDPELIRAVCDAVDWLEGRIDGVERRLRPVGVRRG